MAWIPRKAVGPMYIGRAIPEHVKESRVPVDVDKSRVLKPKISCNFSVSSLNTISMGFDKFWHAYEPNN